MPTRTVAFYYYYRAAASVNDLFSIQLADKERRLLASAEPYNTYNIVHSGVPMAAKCTRGGTGVGIEKSEGAGQ